MTDIKPYNKKGQAHGYWEQYYSNGQLSYKGNFINGKKDGYWEDYLLNGNLAYKGNYVNGERKGHWEVGFNGFTQSEVYRLPVHLRNFYYNRLLEAKKKENEAVEKNKKSSVPKSPSKVRVNR